MATRSIAFTLAAAAGVMPSHAQDTAQTVTVTGRTVPSAGIAGFDDVPLSRAPFAAARLGDATLADAAITQLAGSTRLDAGLSDAYNAEGYWSGFTIRGFVLDPRANVRRDGLPISAETALWLGNKNAVEVLKGTSGAQAGTSAPGGLVNLVVKRPIGSIRSAALCQPSAGTLGAAVDIGDRAGPDDAIGWRVNASHEWLDPLLRSARGTRDGLAVAADWRITPRSVLEAEFELNRQSQPSQPGFSLLGNLVPDARDVDPRINLNNQPWTTPVVFDGRTASLRWLQALAGELQFKAHAQTQHLRSDDRVAFPFGCSAEGAIDRFCSDGSFDFYDYRSDNERRRTDALDLSISGSSSALAGVHRYSVGVLTSRHETRYPKQAFNFVGTGTIDGLSVVPADPTLTTDTADRDERNVELYARDQWMLTPQWSLWLGLRHTKLSRTSLPKDGSPPTDYDQSFTTPWLAASHQLSEQLTAYASWGQGIESTAVPNLPTYNNPGQVLPALKSRQFEAGVKGEGAELEWSLIGFDISRPLASDECVALCTRFIDGQQRHRGIEAATDWRRGAWSLQGSAAVLRARRERARDPAANGLRPTNVPERSLRVQVGYQLADWPGATLSASAAHEGPRMALPDNTASIAAWTRIDLGARIAQRLDAYTLTWRAGVDNLADRRAWKEAPYQFAHAYLFPMAPRTWRASVQAAY